MQCNLDTMPVDGTVRLEVINKPDLVSFVFKLMFCYSSRKNVCQFFKVTPLRITRVSVNESEGWHTHPALNT